MNIAQTANETTEVASTSEKKTKTLVYINMNFTQLAADIIDSNVFTGKFKPQYNGKGRIIVLIPEKQEEKYITYYEDSERQKIMPQPFTINNGDKIKFILQDGSTGDNGELSYKWKGIIQNRYDLHLVSSKKRSATYKAVVATDIEKTTVTSSEEDDVIININFKVNGEKFSAAWDPRLRIKR